MSAWTEYGVLLADRRTVASASSIFTAATYAPGRGRRVVSRHITCAPIGQTGEAVVTCGPWRSVPATELAESLAHRSVDIACGQNSEGE